MPVRPEMRALYPADWPEISHRIRFERADGRCECTGQCGIDHDAEWRGLVAAADGGFRDIETPRRCMARHGEPHPVTGSKVVLTTMHLNHDPADNGDENLLAGCQRCHNRYDAPHRQAGRAQRRPLPLFDTLQLQEKNDE